MTYQMKSHQGCGRVLNNAEPYPLNKVTAAIKYPDVFRKTESVSRLISQIKGMDEARHFMLVTHDYMLDFISDTVFTGNPSLDVYSPCLYSDSVEYSEFHHQYYIELKMRWENTALILRFCGEVIRIAYPSCYIGCYKKNPCMIDDFLNMSRPDFLKKHSHAYQSAP